MAHPSEKSFSLNSFLEKPGTSQHAESRFDSAPIQFDARALDANVEKSTQAVALNSPAAAKFYGRSPIGDKSRDTRLSAGPIGRVFAGAALFGFVAMALSALLAWALQMPDLYSFVPMGFIIAVVFSVLAVAASAIEI